MNVKELYDRLGRYVEKNPEANVRMEVFNASNDSPSILNSPFTLSLSNDGENLTIIGDGIPQKY